MRHTGQARSYVAVRVAAAVLITFAGWSGFAGFSSAQTVINTIQELQNINNNLSGNYVLGKDIDATGFNFIPIGWRPSGGDLGFSGTLDGRGYTISNITINSSHSGGIFSALVNGTLKNIDLVNIKVNVPDAQGVAGGLAALTFYGTIQNSHVSGSVIGGALGGGLVADNAGAISQSSANVSVFAPTAGGLIGQNSGAFARIGTITQSYATGPVKGTGTGQISGVGGLVGHNFANIVQS